MPLLQKVGCTRGALFGFLAAGLACLAAGDPRGDVPNATVSTVHSITLPHYEPELPLAPGRDDYLVVCASCHSARYVLMQPFFLQRQWEETVDKMAKVYGAQIDQEQRSAIVQYLLATHGPDSTRVAARDEDPDFATVTRPTALVHKSPPLALASNSADAATQVKRGGELFATYCAGCHGTTGRGDGFISHVLWRKPKDLATTRFSLDLLGQALWNGKPGTAMPSWRNLPLEDLSALAAYVQSLHQPVKLPKASPQSLERGNQVFMQSCAPCHGVAGDGKGTAATALLPEPANFKLKQPDSDYVLQVLRNGIPGTGMPAWKDQISEPDRKALADFVRSLFKDDSSVEH